MPNPLRRRWPDMSPPPVAPQPSPAGPPPVARPLPAEVPLAPAPLAESPDQAPPVGPATAGRTEQPEAAQPLWPADVMTPGAASAVPEDLPRHVATAPPPEFAGPADKGPTDQVPADQALAKRGPVDLPGNAPTIGRATAPHLGQVNPDTALRPAAVALDGTSAGSYRVAAASLIGMGHLVSGHPRQDSYNFMVGRSGRLYVTVADGLGSKPASQLGANLFTDSVLAVAAHAEAEGTEPVPTELLIRASQRTADIVGNTYQLDPRTASFVGAVAVFSGSRGTVARIGDVSAFTLVDGEFTELFTADNGPVNIVGATMPGERETDIEVVEIPEAPAVAFGTDGLVNDIRNSGALREWLGQQWRLPHLPFAIGDTLRYRRQGSHDDRTAVVVWHADADET